MARATGLPYESKLPLKTINLQVLRQNLGSIHGGDSTPSPKWKLERKVSWSGDCQESGAVSTGSVTHGSVKLIEGGLLSFRVFLEHEPVFFFQSQAEVDSGNL